MSKWILLFLLILLVPTAGAVNYPQLRGFVTDNANIVEPEYEAKIAQLAEKIEKETTVEIAVVTVESFEGESREMYAVKLFEQAGIGKKDKDNGLLILVAKQEREYRFEVGYGLEGIITDSMRANIGERVIVPNFRNGEYGRGIYEAVLVIEGLLTGNEEVVSRYSMQADSPDVLPGWLFFLIFGSVMLMLIGSAVTRHRHGGAGYYGGYGYPGRGYGGRRGGGFGGGFGGYGGGRSGGGGFGGRW